MGIFKKILKKASPLHHMKTMGKMMGPKGKMGKMFGPGSKMDPLKGLLGKKAKNKPIGGAKDRYSYKFE